MHRFYIAPEHWNPDALVLRDTEAHHARDVLRMKPGEKAVLFNGQGSEVTAEATEVARGEVHLRKLQETRTRPLRCRIVLGQAIPKGKNMDLIVQKAVEIGAAEIVPLISERTIVDLDAKEAAAKKAKWQQIAIEAAKQCGQNWLPTVQTPSKVKDFFTSPQGEAVNFPLAFATAVASFPRTSLDRDLRLIGSLQPDALHLKTVLTSYVADHCEKPRDVLILIGPEGDFTPAELSLAKTHGCRPITLGPIILKVETAAIYCLSVLSYELL